jgi:hypothetical protein
MSGNNVFFERMYKFEKAPLKHAEHTRKELMRKLSMRISS